MASRKWVTDRRYGLHREVVDLFAQVDIGTNGAATLTSGRALGFSALVQALASNGAYVASLADGYNSLLGFDVCPVGVPTVSSGNVVAAAVGGSVAAVACASVAAADTITILVPGSSAVTLTAVAYNATPGDNEFCIGNTTGADAESANNIAALIRNDSADAGQSGKGDTNGNGGSTTMPSTVTAWASGAVVCIACTVPGMQIKSSSASKVKVVTTAAGTANAYATAKPGLIFRTAYGVTAAVPASGNKLFVRASLLNTNG